MVSAADISVLAEHIVREFAPERIVLFGSHARNAARSDSDVDLLVLLPVEGKPFWKSLEILNRVNPSFAVDLLARDPEDTRTRYENGDPLIREALDHGKVLYERGSWLAAGSSSPP